MYDLEVGAGTVPILRGCSMWEAGGGEVRPEKHCREAGFHAGGRVVECAELPLETETGPEELVSVRASIPEVHLDVGSVMEVGP